MTVTANVSPINIVNFGQLLPGIPTREPIGYWFVQSQTTGDASAGNVIMNFLLTNAGDASPYKGRSPLGVYFSIEAIRGFTNYTGGACSVDKQLYINSNIITAMKVSGVLVNGSATTALAVCANENELVPLTPYQYIFLCTPTLTSNLSYCWSVNNNGSIYNAYAWGFIWDVKSLLELGGPIKPTW